MLLSNQQMSTQHSDFAASIRDYATRGLATLLGIEIVELMRHRVVATMPVDNRTHQPYGLLHGGASVALAETVASLGSMMNVDHEKYRVAGWEGTVRGTATPIHIGRSTHVWNIEIVDEEGRLVCISRCTVAIIANRPAAER